MTRSCKIVRGRGRKMPAKWGADYVRGSDWEPVLKTAAGWKQFASRKQKRERHPVLRKMTVFVSDCGDYYRINIAGQPIKR